MSLKRIEIQGFKSFGDRVRLELYPGLSVIVGPNGSGKSNIADAISWCLGEHRASQLRGSRMEDIIFAGSDKRKPVGMAEVTLTLDNETKTFPLPYEEIAVTRRLYRSGESEFFINKVPCRLKDIQALFMDTGLGRGAYSLIGQGKVDEILSSRPDERRSVIEEAAGIVKYRYRKEEALRKLAAAEQDLDRISDIINELASRIQPLAAQAAKARQYKELSEQAWQLELSLFKRDWQELTAKAEEIAQQVQQLKKELQDERPVIEEKLEQVRTELLSLEKSITDAREKYHFITSQIETAQNKLSLTNDRLSHYHNEIARAEKDCQEARAALQKLETELHQEKEKLDKLKQEAAAKSASSGHRELHQLAQEMQEKQALLNNLNNDLIDQLNRVAQQRNIKNQAADRKEQLNQRLSHMQRLAGQTAEREKSLLAALERAQDKLQEAGRRKQLLVSGIQQREQELTQINQDLSGLNAKLMRLKETLVAKQSRLRVLDESISSHSSFIKPVRELLKAARDYPAELTGICGAVADLIKVPRGMETAIEAALGSALQNLVTETSDQAKAAIEYLKKHNLGRATFLPLDSLRPTPAGLWEKKALGLPGVIGLASDLTEAAARYRSVVELLLGRLVVVDKLDNAVKAAKQLQQRIRIVTLTGELLHPGGSLTGGGPARNAGGMLHSRREREELARQLQRLQQQINELAQRLADKQLAQRQLTEAQQTCQQQLINLELELQAADIDVSKTGEELQRVRERIQEGQWEIAKTEQEITSWSANEAAAAEKLTVLEQELEQLQIHLTSTQQALAAVNDRKTQLESAVHREQIQQAELRQQILGSQKIMERLTREREEKRMFLSSAEAQLIHLQNRVQELAAQRLALSDQLQGLQQDQQSAAENLDKLKKKHEAEAAVLKQLEERWQKLQAYWQQTREQIHALELQQARNQTELELLSKRLAENGIADPAGIPVAPAASKRQARARWQEIKTQMAALEPVNPGAEAEYREVTERYHFLLGQQQDLAESKRALQQLVEELNRVMAAQFTEAFNIINRNFNQVFQQLFGGGSAAMSLTDKNTLTCGIEITARPPGKKNQNLSLLSGGERALTAIALLFAILQYKPSPFCVLDEIEASLDEANVKRLADYLSRTSQEVQFIVISHRKGTMEQADALYGVTMDEAGVTRLLSMSLEEFKDKQRSA
ncbi:chromosome segregation protein SMC [Desulforamulus hydrothermalis]|uniref:Chromosome partition protein Smc n=1 Tax=Desulforamulus hydrothermalis Lam5 = DSM 18033 TaxID=1121428 RepID=K8DZI1_9FIRM|nr:chromosome segregation protein SMC [Desulforamulus hydrothermalis]CCO08494.1 Chromosome partition protein Smc [Desulforamulus hydrothermalis Lam5 = DSM 18033]SHH29549.1 condensin subunit Smc [Desulforamulus hydrothermalis Lam5 = DSM 18033]